MPLEETPPKWPTRQFSSDTPLLHIEDDKLNRARFCQELADSLAGWKGAESLVVGICGEWGSGKSTIKKFVIDELRQKVPAPHILEFNPWEWSGQHKLLEGFLWQIGGLFGKKDRAKETEELAKKWELFAARITMGKVAQEVAKPFVPYVAILLGYPVILGLVGTFTPWPWPAVAAGVLLLLGLISQAPAVAEQRAKTLRARAELEAKSLDDLKQEIKDELQRPKQQPAIFFIDDIDRLANAEIHLLIQLVKQNGQFPNLIYVLLFQKDIVAKALNEITSDQGVSYLKKIIQVEFDVPLASSGQMQNTLVQGLLKIMTTRGIAFRWSKERWDDLFLPHLWPYFRNLRDVNRFLNAFEFYFNMHTNGEDLEVDPVDLVCVEIIRMFDHPAYLEIQCAFFNESINMSAAMLAERTDQAFARRIESIVNSSERSTLRRRQLEDILYYLFPQGGRNPRGGDEEAWLAGLRICHPRHFGKYFQLSLDPGQPSARERSHLFASLDDRNKTAHILRSSIQKHQFTDFVEFIAVSRKDIPEARLEVFVTALMDVGDTLGLSDDFFTNQVSLCITVIFACLKEVPSRADILWKAVNATNGLIVPVAFIHSEGKKARAEGTPDQFILTADDVARFSDLMVERIRGKAANFTLLYFEQAARVFNSWIEWTNQGEVNAWMAKAVEVPSYARMFLRRLLSRRMTGMTKEWVLHGKYVEKFIALDVLLAAVEKPDASQPVADEVIAIKMLREAVSRKAAGTAYEEITHAAIWH